jgi:N-acyl-D-aspartate/D-glutamate deacylase
VLGLSDGGAHCGIICDASLPTFVLTHWTRDRKRGAKLALEAVVAGRRSGPRRSMGSATAACSRRACSPT